jgi:hypothetical protein
MTNKYYTSLELSKKLKEAGCELESEKMWQKYKKKSYAKEGMIELIGGNKQGFACYIDSYRLTYGNKAIEKKEDYLAYNILWDICIKYCREFWGEGKIMINFGNENVGDILVQFTNFEYHPIKIIEMLQQNKPQEDIENYIIANCIFINKNKEEK